METKQHPFNVLNSINVNEHTELKNGLTYLSWAWAWAEVKKAYPGANYTIWKDESGKPYIYDPITGFMVYTTVTIEGETHEMWLPVMDGANNAMKAEPYDYSIKNPNFKWAKWDDNRNGYFDKYGNEQPETITKHVEAATMFDINKTIMRCLVKNLAMFGLGLYIYAGEDLPEEAASDLQWEKEALLDSINACDNTQDLISIWETNKAKWGKDPDVCAAFAANPHNPKKGGAK